jgi:glycerol-3-phosphate O-acyltransferase
VGAARLGLLSYLWAAGEASGAESRDILFVPVGLAYDRVLEDGLLLNAAQTGRRRFRPRLWRLTFEVLRVLFRRAGGRRHLFGTAAAGFGPPVSLRAWQAQGQGLEALGAHLMAEVAKVVPILPVPLVAAAVQSGTPPADLADRLRACGAVLKLPPAGAAAAEAEGKAFLAARGVIAADGTPRDAGLLAFYAAPVLQRLETAHASDPSADLSGGSSAGDAAMPQT